MMKSTVDTSESSELTYIQNLITNNTPRVVVEVGASDGQWYSMSHPFIEKGWKALCIEPHPDLFRTLEKKYAQHENVSCLQVASANYDGMGKLYLGRTDHSEALSTLCTDDNKWFDRVRSDAFVSVEVRTLNTLFEAEDIYEIGVLSIDAEGMDYEVLLGLDFKRYRPHVIVTETYEHNAAKHKAKHALLQHAGYKHATTIGVNTIWVPDENATTSATQPVTIVVPVFNNWQHVSRCIESLKQHTKPYHEVIIIDDASTEEGMKKRITSAISDMDNVRFVAHDNNMGFVKTCNSAAALRQPNTDVLILNSDTVLTEGAIEEMASCLHANEHHGICTPRSNNATIYSMCKDTRDPAINFTCWKKVHRSLPRFSQMPTAHGFCMMIRSEVVERFGLFDTLYSPGYNEENDLSMCIGRYGFQSICANHAFVFHSTESPSFTKKAQKKLERRNGKLLRRRYPDYVLQLEDAYWEESAASYFAHCINKSEGFSVCIDLTRLPAAWNGTSIYVLQILPRLIEQISKTATVTILTNKNTDRFFTLNRFAPIAYVGSHSTKQYDLVFVPHQISDVVHLSLINRLAPRIVCTVHDAIAYRCNNLKTSGLSLSLHTILKHANACITVSHAAKQDLYDATKERRAKDMHVIHHGWNAISETTSDEDEGILLMIGNQFEHKGINLAVRHMPIDKKAIVIGGHRSFVRKANVKAVRSGDLSQEKISTLFRTCRAIIFPSQYEGFGLPLLEAASYQKPMIAFSTASTREVQKAFGLRNITYMNSFLELPYAIEKALQKKNRPTEMQRTWNDVAGDTADVLHDVLHTPVDIDMLSERFSYINSLARTQVKSPYSTLRTSLWPVRILQRCTSFLLSPFPRLKTQVHHIARHKLKLL